MKVKLEIEFEMETELEESDITKTKNELLNGIRIEDSDVVDGFEITTDFDDCDNTSDFFIKPHSAKIISVEAPEFSKEELCVEDIEVNDNYDGISCQFKTCFDVDKKLGTNINDNCDSWVNFYAEYFPESRELNCEYYVHKPNSFENHSYIPTEEERCLIIFAMEEYCQDNYGENILEFIQSEQEDEAMNMGGIK